MRKPTAAAKDNADFCTVSTRGMVVMERDSLLWLSDSHIVGILLTGQIEIYNRIGVNMSITRMGSTTSRMDSRAKSCENGQREVEEVNKRPS